MIIDLSSLMMNLKKCIDIDEKIDLTSIDLSNTSIRKLKNTCLKCKIIRISDDTFSIKGILCGIMVLPDDITLDDVDYSYEIKIDEIFGENSENDENNIKIVQNTIDILPFLWQNIIVEIPLKIVSDKSTNKMIRGKGWRLISEDEVKANNDSPFSDLQEMLGLKGRSE